VRCLTIHSLCQQLEHCKGLMHRCTKAAALIYKLYLPITRTPKRKHNRCWSLTLRAAPAVLSRPPDREYKICSTIS
jgi:hypothetical protein